MKDSSVYLKLIIDSISKIEKFTSGINKEDFLLDQKTQSAVLMQLTLIGELSNKISEDIKSKIDLPWKDMIGFRNMAVHEYFKLELDRIWKAVQEDIPHLVKEISTYLTVNKLN